MASQIVSQQELDSYRRKYDNEFEICTKVSRMILDMCLQYKATAHNVVRMVFSREPVVKTWPSTIKKIEDKRRDARKSSYGYESLEDIIALTILCPYRSDVDEVGKWLKKAFVIVSHADSKLESGHRAVHYVVSLHREDRKRFPKYGGIKCEIQVKTILEEAFDAKGHDLTYKPGDRQVSDELKKQFAIFASSLHAVDSYSEFLKDLIVSEEKALGLRRKACLRLYLRDRETLKFARRLKIDFDASDLQTDSSVAEKLRGAAQKGVATELCTCAALVALETGDEFLRDETLSYCNSLTEQSGRRIRSHVTTATVKWALGYFEEAIADIDRMLPLARRRGRHRDAQAEREGMNAFVYIVSDWKVYERKENPEWNKRTKLYVDKLQAGRVTKDVADTLGFQLIAFGKTRGEIERGRQLLRKAHPPEGDNYAEFDRYHDFIALRRLLGLLAA